jgi:hypothetical protein
VSGENVEDMRIQGKTCTLRTTEKLAKPVTNKRKLNQRVCGFAGLLTSITVPIVHKDRNMVQYKITIQKASITYALTRVTGVKKVQPYVHFRMLI